MRACICTCLLSCEVHESKLIFHHIPFYGCKHWPTYAFLLTWINLYVEAPCIDELESLEIKNVAVVYLYNKSEILYKIWNQIDVLSFHIEFGIIYKTQKAWKIVCVDLYPAVPVKTHLRVSGDKYMALLAKQDPPEELVLFLLRISPLSLMIPASVKKGENIDLKI